jgi:hypothetical protein
MSPRIRIDIAHRIDFSDPHVWRALAWSLPLSALVGGLVMNFTSASVGGWAIPLGILSFAATLAGSAALAMGIAHGSARGATAFLLPSGGGTPSVKDWSYEKSLLARGRVDEAVAALNAHLAARPDDPALCLLLADVYARQAGDPARAAELFARVRRIPGAARGDDYRATTRLIDLYLGPLDDRARAEAELEWMRTRHAGTEGARHAETALKNLRAYRPGWG